MIWIRDEKNLLFFIIPIPGAVFEAYTFKVCKCGEVSLVRSEDKWFDFSEILWRQIFNPKQFEKDDILFIASGITSKSSSGGFRLKLFGGDKKRPPIDHFDEPLMRVMKR